jgi:muconolactone delta-isomerase
VDINRVTQRDPDDTLDAHYFGLERLYRPHGCYEGFVYIGHIAEDENGEAHEVIERVPCRRCKAESLTSLLAHN